MRTLFLVRWCTLRFVIRSLLSSIAPHTYCPSHSSSDLSDVFSTVCLRSHHDKCFVQTLRIFVRYVWCFLSCSEHFLSPIARFSALHFQDLGNRAGCVQISSRSTLSSAIIASSVLPCVSPCYLVLRCSNHRRIYHNSLLNAIMVGAGKSCVRHMQTSLRVSRVPPCDIYIFRPTIT